MSIIKSQGPGPRRSWPRSARASRRACPETCPRLPASMAGRIPQAFIDELIARADIVEIIGSRVPLKKAGREYKACCPFHDEKTPSFWVSPDKQFYHCFGCGAHGTALGFLMEYDRLPFPEAVEDLAGRARTDACRTRPAAAASRASARRRRDARRSTSCWPKSRTIYRSALLRSERARRPMPRSAACTPETHRALSHRLCERCLERAAAPLRRSGERAQRSCSPPG